MHVHIKTHQHFCNSKIDKGLWLPAQAKVITLHMGDHGCRIINCQRTLYTKIRHYDIRYI